MRKTMLALLMVAVSLSYIYAGSGNKYGKEITLKEKTKISAILANPQKFVGKNVLVEGTVYEIKMTKEQALEQAKHEAEEHGTEFDPASVKGPLTIYQIKGLGAVIK